MNRFVCGIFAALFTATALAADPLPSWNDTGPKKAIVQFVHTLTNYIHHTDAEREWAYDRESHIGKLDKGLEEAQASGWTVVDMKNDWKKVFASE